MRAVEAFSGAIDLDPTDADLPFFRGNALAAAGKYAEAVADFTRAIELRPDYAAAYHNRASANVDAGELDAAVPDFTKAIELTPDDPDPLNGRAAVHSRQRNYEAAYADYEAAIKLAPDTFRSVLQPGECLLRRGEAQGSGRGLHAGVADQPTSRTRLHLSCPLAGIAGEDHRGHR